MSKLTLKMIHLLVSQRLILEDLAIPTIVAGKQRG